MVVALASTACGGDDSGDDVGDEDADPGSTGVDDEGSSTGASDEGSSADASGSSTGSEDAALEDACQQWCVAQSPCDMTDLTEAECTMACIADVGTPGPECSAAIADLATCLQASCEMGCEDELGARDDACGGTG